jgi:uncharacterized membrane protein
VQGRIVWGLLFTALGLVVAFGWLPGSAAWATGPRVGLAMGLMTLGFILVTVALAPWFLRRFTRSEDYGGKCPVGESCSHCGAFNMKPRRVCRSCHQQLTAT